MNSRELFISVFEGKKNARPPFWMMRQAGRYLPEYRQLKSKYSFLEIVKTPELGVEAALQPMRRFGFDCSILFSDILVISEALGLPYNFKEAGGILMQGRIESQSDVSEIEKNIPRVRERLSYVAENLRLLRRELPDNAVLGFAGSPFTIAAYMVEGESSAGFPRFKKLMQEAPDLLEKLLSALERAVSEYAQMQAECGIDAFQIFDSHAAAAPIGEYKNLSGKWIKPILKRLKGKTKSIVFANAMSGRFEEVTDLGADAYSLDSSARLSEIMEKYGPGFCLQGNLPASVLSEDPAEAAAKKTFDIISDMQSSGKHIFNLGHGIRPDAKLENVEAMCETVKNFKA